MIIENQKKVIKLRLRALVMAILCPVLIGLVFTVSWFNTEPLGVEKKYWAYGILIIYIVFFVFTFYMEYYYVYFFTNESKLIVRYYSLRPLSRIKKAIELPMTELAGAEIKKSGLGLKKRLILFQKGKKGVAKYPPISLTALPEKETKQLKELLRRALQPGNR